MPNPRTSKNQNLFPGYVVLACLVLTGIGWSEEAKVEDFAPAQDQLPAPVPDDAIVLLNDSGTIGFRSKTGGQIDWPYEEGELISTRGQTRSNHIVSTLHFRDADIHVEFQLPPEGAGNSGVYIHGNYEMQIIKSHNKQKPGESDMGGLYGFAPPLVQAAKPPGEWQVYDIRYRAPRRDAEGKIVEEGAITAWLNGKQVQDNVRFGEPRSVYHPFRYKSTDYLKAIWDQQLKTSVGPLFLQDHDSPVRFRNVWVRPLDDLAIEYNGDVAKAE
ncbi:3-keto-disaccharide hydrolase [Calycomorphotria hydatis]|uniref:3-keto-alpha-glucoside-1,2-lyase/3-keto-2-hydroxy-glucal hydratase domain-containing protein n=1 Tax=Calycomorphotria hydatis TaxID=2528027 RepID=A0A517T4L1_9PLAN|nr:DUF1080 domain-containing protein [Calycomorphotria hydatis]QDT63326.1 hypothetical protein V22_05460 [Calycomorphotria hydatis]